MLIQLNKKNILILGCIFGAISVAIGAFGAHGLKKLLEETNRTNTFETAIKYQFYHTFLLLFIGFCAKNELSKIQKYAVLCCITGILVFSGSLYFLCLTGITWLGAVTPIGGLLLIASWILLALSFKNTHES